MNSKRKADLQRKLSMVSVPKPPDGLADRIKQDIPQYLGTQRERDRFTKSVAFNLRVAASIILLVSSTYLCLHLLTRASSFQEARVAQPAMEPRAAKKLADIPNGTPPPMRQPVIAPNVPPPVAPRPAASITPPTSVAERIILHREMAEAAPPPPQPPPPESVAVGASADVASPVAAAELQRRERDKDKEEKPSLGYYDFNRAPAPAAAPVAQAQPVAAPAAAPAPASDTLTATTSESAAMAKTLGGRVDLIRSANAAELDFSPRNAVFGISVNGGAFEQVKSAIEHGEHPSHVDVEALVNYFAGPAPKSPRVVSLEVEGSPAPVDEGERTVFVRYTVDTARGAVAPNASVPPVATNAHVEIAFDARSVTSYRRVGGEAKTDLFEPSLLKNVSVTALYAVVLKPNVTLRTPLATITLRYTNVANGKEKTEREVLRVGAVTRPWSQASRRHRLASLGAVWGEKLKQSSTGGPAVARRAEELSKQEPNDELAKELAALTNGSMR